MATRRVSLSRTATASPTSGDFLTLMDAREVAPVLLVKIELRARGGNPARTLRFSDVDFTDDDGNHWLPIIHAKTSLDAGGRYLDTGAQLVDFDLTVGDARLGFQSLTETLGSLLSTYRWEGSAVTVYQAAETLTDPTKWGILLQGEVSEITGAEPASMSISCVQDRTWAVSFPPNTIEKATYPNAPQDVIGVPRPIVIGNHSAGRINIDPPGGPTTRTYLAGIARAPIPTLVYDSGASSSAAQYLISDEELDVANTVALWYASSLGRFAGSEALTVTNTAGGPATMEFASASFRQFYVAVLGIEESSSNNVTTWPECIREDKDNQLSGFADVDYDAGEDTLQLYLPDLSSMGELLSADVRIWYSKNASAASHPQFGIKHASGDVLQSLGASASSTFPSDTPIDSATVDVSARITDWSDIKACELIIECQAAGQRVQVHRLVLSVKFKPAGRVVSGGDKVPTGSTFNIRGQRVGGSSLYTPRGGQALYTNFRDTPNVLSYDAPLWTYQVGVPDQNHGSGAANGTYTGTSGATIEHPADLVHWLLREHGGLAASNITTAASTHGSFADCRTDLANYAMLALASEPRDIDEFIAEVGAQFLIWFHRNNLADGQPWVAVPWETGSAVDYRSAAAPYLFAIRDIEPGTLKVDKSSIGKLRNIVRVNFDYDLHKNTPSQQVFITDTDSLGWTGSAYARDQNAGAPNDRESRAASAVSNYGRKEQPLNLRYVKDPATATDIRNRYFDLVHGARATLRFSTYLNASDLKRGQVIALSDEWDSVFPCPVLDSGATWANAAFRVLRVTRRETAATLYNVEAIEV